jgi:signal recognition particle receptor subunit beta
LEQAAGDGFSTNGAPQTVMAVQADLSGASSSAAARTDAEQPCGEAHATLRGLGAPLEEMRQTLAAIVDRLDGVLGEHVAPLLREAKRQLNVGACRIAVIGQVKAGKSTFINALMGRPRLLPTHVNPWTAVVCSLHLRKSSTPPAHAAIFQLFSAEEWKQLAEGGGHLRELTERLIPGFQPELLRAQLEVMRKRAERRLGSAFQSLLGQCHRFKDLTPEVIAEYVSAGEDYAGATSGRRRLYSDITRAADLYFSDSPFAFPITLIDTPGTNDPFLVRDEITRRSLENTDLYVFVISALQPLSVADIAMLRLLNGLHKDRIVVFINRADQLPNPQVDALVIKAAVEKRLNTEFPALTIPVIWGSARLANLHLELQGAAPGGEGAAGEPRPTTAGTGVDEPDTGMREVSAAITRMMCASGVAMLLRQIAACLAGLVTSAEVTDRAELSSIEESLVARLKDADALRTRIAEEGRALSLFEERATALRKSFREIGVHLDEIVKLGSNMLRTQLRDTVRDFAEQQADELLHAVPHAKAWHCDVTPLRAHLEGDYVAAIARIAAELGRIEQFLYPHLRVSVAGLLPDYDGDLLAAPYGAVAATPPTAVLSRAVALDLGSNWWKRWRSTQRAPIERARQIRRLIQEEFFALVDELVQGAEQHLRFRVDHTWQRADAIGSGLRMGIDQRRANLAAELALLNGSGDDTALERLEREQCERASLCIARRAVYTSTLQELARMLESMEAIQPRP